MAMFIYEVTGNCQGRTLTETVQAHSQQSARQKYLRLNPDYTPGRAVRVERM